MSAADVLTELMEAQVHLTAEGARLQLAAQPGAPLSPALLARVRSVKPSLGLIASGAWRRELGGWAGDLKAAWAERAAIREYEGHQPRELAERAAFLELREAALGPVAALLAAASEAFGPITVTLGASTRPGTEDDGDERDEDDRPVRVDPRPVVHPRCCGGCGCPSLTDGGRGRCARCGWRRSGRRSA